MSDNIKVVVKVRPLISREIEEKLQVQWRVQNNSLFQIDAHGNDLYANFTFDKVYDESAKTSDVYNDIAKPIVEAAVEGFNGTIFAYGQTSSGKTYTMTGNEDEPGIIPLAVLNLFHKISTVPNRDFLVRVSYIEIYNERIRDLLNIKRDNLKVELIEGGFRAEATEEMVSSPEEVLQIMNEGKVNRQIGATNMNEESSRSHSIFQIILESREHHEDGEDQGLVIVSKLNLVDLAGSERLRSTGATGQRFKEGTSINLSLSSLGKVIKQLSENPNQYINFRDSKLTQILQNSLGGNAKTSIICAITPASVEETVSTLQFATRAKTIKNKPEVNEVTTNATKIQDLTKKLAKLHSALESKKNLEQDNCKLTARIAALQKLILTFGARSNETLISSRVKKCAPRRVTISSLHSIDDAGDSVANIPRFCTPVLKYNPLTLSSDVLLNDKANYRLPCVEEEPISISSQKTPSPKDCKALDDEIIDLETDSDDDHSIKICSPYHKCLATSKTPPCVLKKNAKLAEKNLKDIIDFTEREKIYSPNTVELIEKLEQNTCVLTRLQEEVNSLNEQCTQKDNTIRELKRNVLSKDEELKSMESLKTNLETQCKECNVKLTDLEVSYETLLKKSKSRETELLSLLQEHNKSNKDNSKIASKQFEKELSHFMDISKEMSLISSDNESSSSIINEEGGNNENKALISDLQSQLEDKCKLITELEADLYLQKNKVLSLENSTQELQQTIKTYQCELDTIKDENSLLNATIDTLNSTIKNHEESLQNAATSIELYKTRLIDLEMELKNKECQINKSLIDDDVLENIIINEETLIANNENIHNLIQSFNLVLEKRNEEIDKLKNSGTSSDIVIKNKALIEEIEAKNSKIDNLVGGLKELENQLDSNVVLINNLTKENSNLKMSEAHLLEELKQSRLQSEKNAKERELILKTKEEVQETCVKLVAEKNAINEEFASNNEDLNKQIQHLSQKLAELQSNIEQKDEMISTELEKNSKTLISKVSPFVKTVNEIFAVLGEQPDQELADNTDDYNLICDQLSKKLKTIQANVVKINNQRDDMKINASKLTEQLSVLTKAHDEKISTMSLEIKNLHNVNEEITEKCKALVIENRQLTCEFEKLNNIVTSKTEELNVINNKFNEVNETNASLLIQKNESIEALSNIEYEHKCQITTILEQHASVNEKLKLTLSKITEIKRKLNLSNEVLEPNDFDNTVCNQIIQDFEILGNEIITLRCDIETRLTKQITEHKQELVVLIDQNKNMIEELGKINQQNKLLNSEVKALQLDREEMLNTLSKSKEVIETLHEEIKEKNNQLLNIEKVTEQWKETFLDRKSTTKIDINQDPQNLESLVTDLENRVLTENDTDFDSSQRSLLDIIDLVTPVELKSMCYKKVIDMIQPKDTESSSVSKSASKTSTDVSNKQSQYRDCHCDNLLEELNKVLKENVQIKNILQEMEDVNQYLLKERDEVRQEINLLLEPVTELQKKIGNHRTNLSTLTATTYAENKLLKSQVKVLQHHHNRCHKVCQKDLPVFKKQLIDLMAILKSEYYSDKCNASFKRFSLPDVLDKNSTMYTIKNESTLDGDLLMLDTNVTLASADNTLLGPDQSCLEITQICLDNEATSKIDPTVLYSQIEILTQEHHKMYSLINVLKEENMSLHKQLCEVPKSITEKVLTMDSQTSPVKIRSSLDKNEDLIRRLEEECVVLKNDLSIAKSENAILEEKHNSLSLKIVSYETELKKLHDLDVKYQTRIQEIGNLKQKIKEFQEENDLLSTQLMENIEASEDLKKQLEIERENNLKINNNLVNTRKSTNCQDCLIKDEIIKKSPKRDIAEGHVKLNRSNSDSETGSRCNKISTLQNELQESIEDCIKIKYHLESTGLSNCEDMDLDVSKEASNIFAITTELNVADSKNNVEPAISEQKYLYYVNDKNECFKYYLEKIGSDKENLPQDAKIIDVMKMLYNKLVVKHVNEVENLVNNLRDFEDAKKNLECQISELKEEYLNVTNKLEEKENNMKTVAEILSKIRFNINSMNNDIDLNVADSSDTGLELMKDKLFKVLDSEFGTQSLNIFDKVCQKLFVKHQSELSSIMQNYKSLQSHMDTVSSQLMEVNRCLEVMKLQLTERDNECNLLKAQKEKMHEISSAVTLEIVSKEKELREIIDKGINRLVEQNILSSTEIEQFVKSSPAEVVNSLYDYIILKLDSNKMVGNIENQKSLLDKIKQNETELLNLKSKYVEMVSKLDEKTSLLDNVNKQYNSQIEENNKNLKVIETLTTDINNYKKMLNATELTIETLKLKQSNDDAKVNELLQTIERHEEEITSLRKINKVIENEKETCQHELNKAKEVIESNKHDFDIMAKELSSLKDSIKQDSKLIEDLRSEAKSLLAQNHVLKNNYEGKVSECSRLEKNIKIHEKTAEVQSNMINRLQKQEEECKKSAHERENNLEELRQKCASMEKEYESLKVNYTSYKDENCRLQAKIKNLETRVSELELDVRPRSSLDGIMENSRRRRQSLHDSKQMFEHETNDQQDHKKLEALFGARSTADDFFMDVDEDGSRGTTPISLGKRRDSFVSRHEDITGDDSSGKSSLLASAARRRRQSVHDQHRAGVTPEPHDHPLNKLRDKSKSAPSSANHSLESTNEVSKLQEKLASCQRELEELRESYKELDEECETCAEYLRERDEQCLKLKKEKAALEVQVTELKQRIDANHCSDGKRNFVDATVNTDEDWANLHNVVVDRMSFDAEVEKNKHLTKAIEEFRFKNRDLKATVAKMQKALEKYADRDYQTISKDLESTRAELRTCRAKLEDLREKYKELDEECETCSQYLRERDEQCRKLKEAKSALEAKLLEVHGEPKACQSLRKKRQSLHDQNRSSTIAAEDTTLKHEISDVASFNVEDENSSQHASNYNLQQLQKMVEKLKDQKAALERQLKESNASPVYVATGSAIVQNQQMTDVMKENLKLKKINTKLINICKKRGKNVDVNRVNDEPQELG